MNTHALLILLVIFLINTCFRLLPAYTLASGKETPKAITYLANVLPYAVMGMLIVYCLKGTTVTSWPYGLPELISVVYVALIHWWKHNTVLSLITGTALYMVLVQLVFA